MKKSRSILIFCLAAVITQLIPGLQIPAIECAINSVITGTCTTSSVPETSSGGAVGYDSKTSRDVE